MVTLGCSELEDVPGSPRRYLDRDVVDPAGRDLAEVRRIRDDLAVRVEALLADLLTGVPELGGSEPRR